MFGTVSESAGCKMGLRQEGLPVPELYILNVVVWIVGVGVFGTHFYFHLEFFTLLGVLLADYEGGVSVEIVFSDLFLFLADIDGGKNSWHDEII